jgi:hypothetical protein
MEATKDVRSYRSPLSKLLPFFRDSRDGWKSKCLVAKTRIKRLENRVAGLIDSRRRWKEKARAYKAQIAKLAKELEREKRGCAGTAAR